MIKKMEGRFDKELGVKKTEDYAGVAAMPTRKIGIKKNKKGAVNLAGGYDSCCENSWR